MIEDVKEEELIEATEELFLQKISTDEDESFMQAITMKRASISTDNLEEVVSSSEDFNAEFEVVSPPENTPQIMEETRSHTNSTLKRVSPKRPNFIKRFLAGIWGS